LAYAKEIGLKTALFSANNPKKGVENDFEPHISFGNYYILPQLI